MTAREPDGGPYLEYDGGVELRLEGVTDPLSCGAHAPFVTFGGAFHNGEATFPAFTIARPRGRIFVVAGIPGFRDGRVEVSVTDPAPVPRIERFDAPGDVAIGESATLAWSAPAAAPLTLIPGGDVTGMTSRTVVPFPAPAAAGAKAVYELRAGSRALHADLVRAEQQQGAPALLDVLDDGTVVAASADRSANGSLIAPVLLTSYATDGGTLIAPLRADARIPAELSALAPAGRSIAFVGPERSFAGSLRSVRFGVFGPDGTPVWSSAVEVGPGEERLAVGAIDENELVLAIEPGQAVTLGAATCVPSAAEPTCILRVRSDGTVPWMRTLPGFAIAFAVASDGSSYVVSSAEKICENGNGRLLTRLETDGGMSWNRCDTPASLISVESVAADEHGGVFCGLKLGAGGPAIAGGERPLHAEGYSGAYITRFTPDGGSPFASVLAKSGRDEECSRAIPLADGSVLALIGSASEWAGPPLRPSLLYEYEAVRLGADGTEILRTPLPHFSPPGHVARLPTGGWVLAYLQTVDLPLRGCERVLHANDLTTAIGWFEPSDYRLAEIRLR